MNEREPVAQITGQQVAWFFAGAGFVAYLLFLFGYCGIDASAMRTCVRGGLLALIHIQMMAVSIAMGVWAAWVASYYVRSTGALTAIWLIATSAVSSMLYWVGLMR